MLARVDIRHAPAYQVCSWLWYAGSRSLFRFHIGGTMSISSVTVSSLWKTWNAYSDIWYHAKALNFLILRVTPSCSLEHFFQGAMLFLRLIFYLYFCREPCFSLVWFFTFLSLSFFCREPCYSFVWSLSPLQLQILDLSHSEIEYKYNHILKQGGRTWQPFVGGKNGRENFRQARIYNFRDKCVIFVRNRKFANLTQ